jgi:hypothetical protein
MRVLLQACCLAGLATLVGCGSGQGHPSSRPFQAPTATEVFNLRSRCTELGQRFGNDYRLDPRTHDIIPHDPREVIKEVTHYDPRSNRCYVKTEYTSYKPGSWKQEAYVHELYDGQTGELLAKTVVEAPQDNDPNFLEHQKRSGVILLDNWQEFCCGLGITASQMPAASGNYNYELAALVIDRAMADDRKQ